jgi:hypothetical protein
MTIEVNDDVGRFIAEMLDERGRQDTQHGGPAHDDGHSRGDWYDFVEYQLGHGFQEELLARCYDRSDPALPAEWLAQFESRMVKIAALALAAVESDRRKYGSAIAGDQRVQ